MTTAIDMASIAASVGSTNRPAIRVAEEPAEHQDARPSPTATVLAATVSLRGGRVEGFEVTRRPRRTVGAFR